MEGGLAGVAVFREVDAGKDADRRGHQHRQAHDHQAADDGVSQATAFGAGRWRVFGEQAEFQGSEAVGKQHEQDGQQRNEAERHRGHGQREAHQIGAASASVEGGFGHVHQKILV